MDHSDSMAFPIDLDHVADPFVDLRIRLLQTVPIAGAHRLEDRQLTGKCGNERFVDDVRIFHYLTFLSTPNFPIP